MSYKQFLLFLFVVQFFIGCEVDNGNYSKIPDIEFLNAKSGFSTDLLGNETKQVKLEFYLIDGDGNVGLSYHDTIFPFIGDSVFNYFSDIFYLKNGKWYKDTLVLDIAKDFIIPKLDEYLGLDKVLKANVFIDYEYTLQGNLFPYDTIMYSFYIYDRSLNKSNVEYSDTIVFLKH